MHLSERRMREYVVEMVRRTVGEYGLPERPTAAQVIEALGLPRPKHVGMRADRDGYRIGRQIYINREITVPERVEFTTFHEILHILIEDDGEIVSELHDHEFAAAGRKAEVTRMEEDLCNLGAAEFALPSRAFRALMEPNGWEIGAVGTAASAFRCSVVAAAFQFAHWCPTPCVVLVCDYGYIPRGAGTGPTRATGPQEPPVRCLYVAYAPCHPEAHTMCRHVPVPPSHLIHQAWLDKTALTGEDAGFFRRPRNDWRIPCAAACVGRRVVAAFYTRGTGAAKDPGQLALFDA